MAAFFSVASGLGTALLRQLDPETAHGLTIRALRLGRALKLGLGPSAPALPTRLAIDALGLHFPSPLGLAAGFDKNAEVPDAMLGLGFGFVEVGTITPQPQAGNPRPRLFRLSEDQAVINRLGFNNYGLAAARVRLAARTRSGIVAVNVGANRTSADPVADYATCIRALAPFADLLVLNISSPNTPGLRDLQMRGRLESLLAAALGARADVSAPPPLLVKIAPDLTRDDVDAIVAAAVASGAEGLIVGNTTVGGRDGLRSSHRGEAGGLSGRPLFARSTEVLGWAYQVARGRLSLVGTGGVASGADAYAKIRAGAALVELYTALVYRGPAVVGRIHAELDALLAQDGFDSAAAAVGANWR